MIKSWMLWGLLCAVQAASGETTLSAQNELLFQQLQEEHGLSDDQMRNIRAIFARSGFIGQGNPAVSQHPETPQQCLEKLAKQSVHYANSDFEQGCGAKYMAPSPGVPLL